MDTQVKQLKLNVTNIKSYLISSNKELKKLKFQKKELFFKIEYTFPLLVLGPLKVIVIFRQLVNKHGYSTRSIIVIVFDSTRV